MRKNVIIALAMLLAGIGITKSQENDMVLTLKQQCLVAIVCQEARGDLNALSVAINDGFDAGLTMSEIKESLSQLYAYTGFPRSINGLGTLQKVAQERADQGKTVSPGEEPSPLPDDYDALKQGTEVQTQLVGGTPFTFAFSPSTDYYLKAHLFGDIFARDNLTHAQRELVTVSALSGIEGVAPQLESHVRGAINMGLSEEEIRSIPAVLEDRVGRVEAERCHNAIVSVFNDIDDVAATATKYHHGIAHSPYPIGEPNTAYAQYFIGNSYVASLDAENGGPVNVTFEPRCRNNWHIHHHQVQVLVCVAGRGWYQEWGKEAVEMTPGTVIAIPAETKHWHGAAANSWFQHLTYHTHVGEGASNEWLEPVTDDIYIKLP